MRIISGILKGKQINFIKNLATRPLKDSVKENIFNILKHSKKIETKIERANILDLYSGIGSFGLECISRNSKKVTFVEKDIKVTNILRNNLCNNSILDKALIINDRVENFLENCKNKYNIFFLDPPFADKEFIKNLRLMKAKKIYTLKHVIIIHRESRTNDQLDECFSTLFTKKYGRSKIIFGTFN